MQSVTFFNPSVFAKAAAAVCASTLLAASALAAPLVQGTWLTTLQARDLDGNGQTDAFYDTKLNITWLRNANVNGAMDFAAANAWANNYSIGGYSDWRLPTMVDPGVNGCPAGDTNPGYWAGGTQCGFNVLTSNGATVFSEMASLYYDTLGNISPYVVGLSPADVVPGAWGLANTGDFVGLLADYYWTGLSLAEDNGFAWTLNFDLGYQENFNKFNLTYAMAVRPGDINVVVTDPGNNVPEPGSLALAFPALAGLVWIRKRRPVELPAV